MMLQRQHIVRRIIGFDIKNMESWEFENGAGVLLGNRLTRTDLKYTLFTERLQWC